MKLADIAWKNGILPSVFAKAMGCSKAFMERTWDKRLPTEKTVERAQRALERLGVNITRYQITAEFLPKGGEHAGKV